MASGAQKTHLRDGSMNMIWQIHDNWLDLPNRHMWIHGIHLQVDENYAGQEPGVEFMMTSKIIKNLHLLRMQSETEPVIIHLQTCGGIYEEGMAIYDAISAMPCNVTIISYTHARSMSSIILQAADHRILMPNSCFMFHYGTLEVSGEVKTVESNVDWNKQATQTMVDIYVSKMKKAKKFAGKSDRALAKIVTDLIDRKGDVFLTAPEAVEWGFADYVFEVAAGCGWQKIKELHESLRQP